MKRSDPADAPPVWLSTAQATALLGVSARTIYGLVNRGELPAYRIGEVIRIRRADLDDYLADQRLTPGDLDHLVDRSDKAG